jgi:hypothetical protein
VLAWGINERGGARIAQPEFIRIGPDRIIGSVLWLGDEPRERYEVLTIRDGKIVDMQGCRSKREAERFARRH